MLIEGSVVVSGGKSWILLPRHMETRDKAVPDIPNAEAINAANT